MLLTVLQCLAGVEFLRRYVLVDAPDEAAARELGRPALHDLYADDGTSRASTVSPIDLLHGRDNAHASNLRRWRQPRK